MRSEGVMIIFQAIVHVGGGKFVQFQVETTPDRFVMTDPSRQIDPAYWHESPRPAEAADAIDPLAALRIRKLRLEAEILTAQADQAQAIATEYAQANAGQA